MSVYRTQNLILGRAFVNTLLAALAARAGAALIVAAKVRLSKDPAFNPTSDSLIADLTPQEADYTGYAAGGVAWVPSAPFRLSSVVQGVIGDALFSVTGPVLVTAQTYGYWIDDGANVIGGERFAPAGPFGMGSVGDFLELDLRIPLGLSQSSPG